MNKRGGEMDNIILIGMPGSGKTTIGMELSRKIGYGYVDSDNVIVAREEKPLAEIIAEVGNEGFLDVEAKVNSQLCVHRCVIATGGSVVYRDYAMQKLKQLGKVVYLQLSYDEIEARLGDLKARGVVLKEGYTLKNLYEERTPLYEKYADVIVRLNGQTVAQSVAAVAEAVTE